MDTYAKAYREVNLILKYISPKYYSKIPQNIIYKIQNEMDTTYNPDVENTIWMEETKAILYNLFRDYLSTQEQKEILMGNEYWERQLIEEEKSKKYNSNIFGNNEPIINNNLNTTDLSDEQELTSEIQTPISDDEEITSSIQTMVPYQKESFIQKMISKIKRIFSKK